jgi:hypothetical protein
MFFFCFFLFVAVASTFGIFSLSDFLSPSVYFSIMAIPAVGGTFLKSSSLDQSRF